MKARIAEIFESIDGEVNYYGQGIMSTFIRFAGCNASCPYCDTKKYQDINSGAEMDIKEIIKKTKCSKKVTITGGEPMLQPEPLAELVKYYDAVFVPVTIETNGITPFDKFEDILEPYSFNTDDLSLIIDVKTPSSGCEDRNCWANLEYVTDKDILKFVIQDRNDFDYSIEMLETVIHRSITYPTIAFSPVHGLMPAVTLLKWIKESKIEMMTLATYLNCQIHKYLGLK